MNPVIEKLWNQASQESDGWEAQVVFVKTLVKLVAEECALELSRVPGGYDSTLYYSNITTLRKHFEIKNEQTT